MLFPGCSDMAGWWNLFRGATYLHAAIHHSCILPEGSPPFGVHSLHPTDGTTLSNRTNGTLDAGGRAILYRPGTAIYHTRFRKSSHQSIFSNIPPSTCSWMSFSLLPEHIEAGEFAWSEGDIWREWGISNVRANVNGATLHGNRGTRSGIYSIEANLPWHRATSSSLLRGIAVFVWFLPSGGNSDYYYIFKKFLNLGAPCQRRSQGESPPPNRKNCCRL